MTCEILQQHPEGLKIYRDFKKPASFYIETEFNDTIPTYNEFISNKKIKDVFGIIHISKVKDEIGVSFPKEISNQQLINLKKAISKTNNKIKDFVYLLFNVKQRGQADLYTWGLRKVKGNLDIQAKLDRAIQQATNTTQSNDKIRELQNKVNQQGIQGDLFNQRYSTSETNNNNLQEGLQWLKQIMSDVEPKLVDGLIDNIANGSYNILEDLITLSKDYANKNVIKEEAFHRLFNLLPKAEQEKLLNEGSKKYGIKRGKSTATIKYSQADQNKVDFGLKAVDILQSDKAKQVFDKGIKNGWTLDKVLNEIGGFANYKQLFNQEDLGKKVSELGSSTILINDIINNIKFTENIKLTSEGTINKWGKSSKKFGDFTIEYFPERNGEFRVTLKKDLNEIWIPHHTINLTVNKKSNIATGNLLGLPILSLASKDYDYVKDFPLFEKYIAAAKSLQLLKEQNIEFLYFDSEILYTQHRIEEIDKLNLNISQKELLKNWLKEDSKEKKIQENNKLYFDEFSKNWNTTDATYYDIFNEEKINEKNFISVNVNNLIDFLNIEIYGRNKKEFDKKFISNSQVFQDNNEQSLNEQLALDIASNYSYTIEINTAKESNNEEYFERDGKYYFWDKYSYIDGGDEHIEITKEQYEQGKYKQNSQHYSNLTVPGGTAYTENAIRIPGVVNVISANGGYHDNDFNQSRGDMAGWFRSDDKTKESTQQEEEYIEYDTEDGETFIPNIKQSYTGGTPTKTRRILEVQSFFQKVREHKDLVSKKGKYYRVLNVNLGNDITFEPKSYSEAFEQKEDGKWYPIYNKYGGYWKSTIPEISASKNIGSAVMGNWTASGMPKEGAFFIYELEEGLEPDYDISHLEIGDFKQLQEVRYRKPVKGKLIGEFKITPDIHNIFSENYDLMSEDGGINKHYELEDSFEKKYGYRPYDDNAPESAIETFNKVQDEYWKNQSLKVEKALQNIHNKYDEQFKQNQFLQLLNKDNNWVTFFVKSIIQDSAKKGYEKVLFPTGNTASKVEGHTTLEEFKKQKEDRIKELEKQEIDNQSKIGTKRKTSLGEYIYSEQNYKEDKENIDTEINQLKQELERVEKEGFGALKPIYNFYENTVTNILNKQYGKENVNQITDEYGNTWNEVTITPKMAETIRLNTPNGKIEYTGDLAIEEKMAEEAYNSKDEKVPTTLIGKFIQSIRNLFRNIFKERDNISRLIRNLNQGRFNLQGNQNSQGVRYSTNQTIKPGVEELFNENPDFSSQIYEALGFQGNINLESNLKNTGKTEQELIDYLKQKYPEIKLNITNNPVWEKGDNVSNQTIENEMGEEYWKELYSNKRLSNREEFESIRIPTIKNKYKPDYENVYHGTNTYHLDNEGNLILTPSRNFENKTESISLTQIPVVAQDYMLRKQGNVIIKISNDALPSNYTVESAEEIAINGNKPFIVKKGMFEIIKVQTLAEKMKAKYASEVEQRADELRNRAKSDLHLLDAIYSERIAADNYSEIQEYENDSQREQAPDWYVPDEYLDSRAANKVYSDLKNKINKDWIIKTLSDLLIDQIKNTGEFIPSIESALENISQYGNRNAPHQSTLWEELLSEIGLGFKQTYYSRYSTDEEIAKAREKQKEKQDLIDKIEEIVYTSSKSSIDFYNSTEQKQKRAEQKRIDEENHKKFLENLPKYRQEIDDLPFQKINGKIIGQANIKAMTVLVDAVNKKADTIPHEYAHHYIAWFRDTPIVQEGIKRFGSEEALVQAIGEQVVKQKGEAYNWWKKFTNWILSLLSDKQLLQVLTDSFLNRQDLNDFTYNQVTPQQKQQATSLFSEFLDVYLQDYEQVEKILKEEKIIDKDCNGVGKLKAEKGLQTNFTKGGKWKLIKDLKGYPTHKEGGVDLTISRNGVSIKNGNTEFTAKHGLVIPKN